MDKEKIGSIIELLDQIKDHLKDEPAAKVNVKDRYELRYWDDDERPSNPDLLSDSFDDMRDALYVRVKAFYKAELKDTKTGKIVISYNEDRTND